MNLKKTWINSIIYSELRFKNNKKAYVLTLTTAQKHLVSNTLPLSK